MNTLQVGNEVRFVYGGLGWKLQIRHVEKEGQLVRGLALCENGDNGHRAFTVVKMENVEQI
jgi:hypothetical protein